MLRALLFGGGWTLAIYPIPLLLWPEFFLLTTSEAWFVGYCSAFASAMALWTATRLPATSSWLKAIVGWIVGFNLVPFIIGFVHWIIAGPSGR